MGGDVQGPCRSSAVAAALGYFVLILLLTHTGALPYARPFRTACRRLPYGGCLTP